LCAKALVASRVPAATAASVLMSMSIAFSPFRSPQQSDIAGTALEVGARSCRENARQKRYTLSLNGRIPKNRIEDYQAFTAIVEKRSLTAAARQLGRSLQSVSRSLAALE